MNCHKCGAEVDLLKTTIKVDGGNAQVKGKCNGCGHNGHLGNFQLTPAQRLLHWHHLHIIKGAYYFRVVRDWNTRSWRESWI